MRYIEQIKSIVLAVLILLSLALTFTIWTFTPSLEPIVTTSVVEVELGEKRTVEQVVQPLKVLYQFSEENITGTNDQEEVNLLLSEMKQWQIHDLAMVVEDAPIETVKTYMHGTNRAVLYYPGPVPFPVFDEMMEITDKVIPEASFDRVVIEWGEGEMNANDFTMYFINTKSGRVYTGSVSTIQLERFESMIVQRAFDYAPYITNEKIGELPIYIQKNAKEVTTYRYLQEDIAPQRFVDGLFENPSSVQSTGAITNKEYSDESDALMGVDDTEKSIIYVQPKAETSDPAIPSDLIFKTVDFINSHSGWTNDYRYFEMAPLNQQIEYRLFVGGSPVFGSLATNLTLNWGIDAEIEQIFRYERPFYILESWAETGTTQLPSGEFILEAFNHLEKNELEAITDIIPGYELKRDEKEPERLLSLEPAWYFKADGKWRHLSKEMLGGGQVGLE